VAARAPSGRYEAAERELAYRVWRQAGGSMAETLRVLDAEHDWPLSRQTLFDWRGSLGWEARRAAEEAEERRRQRAAATDRLAMLAGLDLQIERYAEAFGVAGASGEMPDPRAVSAYAGLMRLRLELARDMDAGAGLDRGDIVAAALEWLSAWVAERMPQHAEALREVLAAAAGPLAEWVEGAG
jgi:hypothetical protein